MTFPFTNERLLKSLEQSAQGFLITEIKTGVFKRI